MDGNGKSGFPRDDLGGNGNSTVLRELVRWDHGNDVHTGTGINPNRGILLREYSMDRGLTALKKNIKTNVPVTVKTKKMYLYLIKKKVSPIKS